MKTEIRILSKNRFLVKKKKERSETDLLETDECWNSPVSVPFVGSTVTSSLRHSINAQSVKWTHYNIVNKIKSAPTVVRSPFLFIWTQKKS